MSILGLGINEGALIFPIADILGVDAFVRIFITTAPSSPSTASGKPVVPSETAVSGEASRSPDFSIVKLGDGIGGS